MDSSNLNPFVYQDLMNPNMGMIPPMGFGTPFMTGMYPTSMLGGTRLQPQPDRDKFVTMKANEQKEKNIFLKSLGALFVIGGTAALLFRGKLNIGKGIAAPFKWIGSKIKAGCKATGKGVSKSAAAVGKGSKKLGSLIDAPFKWIGSKFKKKH